MASGCIFFQFLGGSVIVYFFTTRTTLSAWHSPRSPHTISPLPVTAPPINRHKMHIPCTIRYTYLAQGEDLTLHRDRRYTYLAQRDTRMKTGIHVRCTWRYTYVPYTGGYMNHVQEDRCILQREIHIPCTGRYTYLAQADIQTLHWEMHLPCTGRYTYLAQ